MLAYLLRRIALVIPTFLGITVLAFFLIRLAPGDPILVLAGERGVSAERYAELRELYGFNQPLFMQYLDYVWQVLHGDLGISVVTKTPVLTEFLSLFPATFELALAAMLLALLIGLPAGVIAAVRRNSVFDYSLMGTSLVGYSMPLFWWALLLFLGTVWGVTFSLAKIATEGGGHPLGITYWQSLIGAAFLIALSLATRQKLPMKRGNVLVYVACGLLGSIIPGVLFFYAASRVSPGVLSITIATVPLMTFAAAALLGIEKFRVGRVLGVIFGALSIVLLVAPKESLPDPSAVPWVLAALLAARIPPVRRTLADVGRRLRKRKPAQPKIERTPAAVESR